MFYYLPSREDSPLSIRVKQLQLQPRPLSAYTLKQKTKRGARHFVLKNVSVDTQETPGSPRPSNLSHPKIQVSSRCTTPIDMKTGNRETYRLRNASVNSSFIDLNQQPNTVYLRKAVPYNRPFSASIYRRKLSTQIKSKVASPRPSTRKLPSYNSYRLKKAIVASHRSLSPYGMMTKEEMLESLSKLTEVVMK
mmetsp:Transcript_1568/g.3346  ORF Transcript_1568/g.3346 Transcript_1568/m.3346 type:complete len:193 (-) Transcript_1568:1057-1635(-)